MSVASQDMRVLPPLLAVVLVGALFTSASAQQEDTIRLAINPSSAELDTDKTLEATLTLTNNGLTPITATLSANETGFQISFSRATAVILPQQAVNVTAAVRALNRSLGSYQLMFHARDDAQSLHASALLSLTLRDPPPPNATNTTQSPPPPANATNTTQSPPPPPPGNPQHPPPPEPEPQPQSDEPQETGPNAHSQTEPTAQNETAAAHTPEEPTTNDSTHPPPIANAPPQAAPPTSEPTRRVNKPPPPDPAPPTPLPNDDNPPTPPREHSDEPRPPAPAQPEPRQARLTITPNPLVILANGTTDLRVDLEGEGRVILQLWLPPGYETDDPQREVDAPATLWYTVRAQPNAPQTGLGQVSASNLAEPTEFRINLQTPTLGTHIATQTHLAQAPLIPLALLAAALGAAALAGRKTWPALAALYTRIPTSRTLAHPARERLHHEITSQPGLHVRELRRRLDLAPGALDHHLRALARAKLIDIVTDGQYRRVYPIGANAQGAAPLATRMLQALPARAADAARAVGVSRQAAHYHLKRLAAEGRVSVDRGFYRPSDGRES